MLTLTLSLTLFQIAVYETPGYEKIKVRNVWHPFVRTNTRPRGVVVAVRRTGTY